MFHFIYRINFNNKKLIYPVSKQSKEKQSLHGHEWTPRALGSWGFQNFQITGMWRWQDCQSYAPVAFNPQEILLILISVGDQVDPKVQSVAGRIMSMKNPSYSIGNRNGNLPVFSAMPQQIVPPRALTFMIVSNFYSSSCLVLCYELYRKLNTLEFPVIGSPLQNLKKADICTGNSDPVPRRHFQNEVFRKKNKHQALLW
jgi:hypothetical protein